ncbi:MAG TPA: ABC transporter ATP-binding protein [Limnochordia bacterium]
MEVEGVSKRVVAGGVTISILEDVSFSVPRGQFLAIVGPSGSGKSTLLGLLAGLDAPSEGRIRVGGVEITRLGENALARLRGRMIGFVFQAYHLISSLTAEENVALPLELAGERGAIRRARELLAAVGLQHRARHYPIQLSGGEQQRVALARAFAARPPLLLADEPTGNLDQATGRSVMELLMSLNREAATTLVLVTHAAELAQAADRVLRLVDGRIQSDA